jgi:hypothetical protein
MKKLSEKYFGKSDNPDPRTNFEFIDASFEGLQLQTRAHMATWKLGEKIKRNVDMNLGELTFNFSDGKLVRTNIQVKDSYNFADGIFLRGRDHPSVPENLAKHAEVAKEWSRKTMNRVLQRLVPLLQLMIFGKCLPL